MVKNYIVLEESPTDDYSHKSYIAGYYNNMGYFTLNSVLNIILLYNETIIKEDIYVKITKLILNTGEYPDTFIYETNISSIPEIKTYTFWQLKYIKDSSGSVRYFANCFFKKNKLNSFLLLYCSLNDDAKYHLDPITNEIRLNDIHERFNFIIEPIKNDDIIYTYSSGSRLLMAYPEIIDLSLSDTTNIKYFIYHDKYKEDLVNITIPRFRLNINSSDLVCQIKWNYVNAISSCNVPLNHFKGEKSGYFYTYKMNHLDEWAINYEVPPIYILLPEENTRVLRIKEENNKNEMIIGKMAMISLVTDYNDGSENIFYEYGLIKQTFFDSIFYDENGNDYPGFCVLFKSMKENNIKRIIWMTGVGIHHEVPGPVKEMLDKLCESQPDYVKAADTVMNSGLEYTLLRGAHLTDGDNRKYFVQKEGEFLHAYTCDRIAIAEFFGNVIDNCDLYKNDSVGVTN